MRWRMRRAAATALMAGTLLAVPVAVGADHIAPHQHVIITASGEEVLVGPDACQFGRSRQFDEFHANVHRGEVFTDAFTNLNNPVLGEPRPCPTPAPTPMP